MFATHRVNEDLWRSMNSKNFSANDPRGLVGGIVMPIMSNGNVVGYVPLKARRHLENKSVPGLPAKMPQISLVKVTLRRPSDKCKSNIVPKELRTNVEMVARIQRPEDIPPNPPYETVELVATMHTIHF